MGEKIRDIRPIHLIGREVMVELNEGYTREQGHLIHIQNPQFRYALTESDFIRVASLIMRANVELRYIKTHNPAMDKRAKRRQDRAEEYSGNPSKFSLLSTIQDKEIPYRVVTVKEKMLSLLIPSKQLKKVYTIVKQAHGSFLPHPFGKENGYDFLYQMTPFIMVEAGGLYYELLCQIPCMSLTPKTFIPLDRKVQASAWENKKTVNGVDYLCDVDAYIYRLTSCIFLYRKFDSADRAYFHEKKAMLFDADLKEKLDLILFRFTPTLLELMKQDKYDEIITHYFSFTEY